MANGSIEGRVVDSDTGAALTGLLVEARDTGQLQSEPLGTAETNADGAFDIALDERIRRRLIERKVQVYFRLIRDGEVIADTMDDERWDPVDARPVLVRARAGAARVEFDVHGTVVTDRGTYATGLVAEVWDKQLRGEQRLGEITIDRGGQYRITYDPAQLTGKQRADVEVRIRVPSRGDEDRAPVVRSKVTYQAPASLQVDLVAPFDALPRETEHDRMLTSIRPLLADTPAREIGPEGVMFLANRGGFDPRAVAMSLKADRASAETGIPVEHYYALFRSGAAVDVTSAHQLTDARFASAIESAVKSGVISDSQSIEASLEIHRSQARQAFRSYVPAGGMSSLDDLLGLRLDDAGKDVFIDQLRATQGDPESLWTGLAQAGMEDGTIARLRTDGKLGHLTLQNVGLMKRLVETAHVDATGDLVAAGLYEPEQWIPLIGDDVPAGLTKESYAAGLAAQVRHSHPTLVTADLVKREEVSVGSPEAASKVAEFLVASDTTQRIGVEPIRTWNGFADLDEDAQRGALQLERLYQITPSDASMKVLSQVGLDSALAVARYGETEFLAQFGDQFPSTREAMLVHRKSQQVHAMVLNTTVDYLRQRGGPRVYALGGPQSEQPLAEGTPGKATLETLFGNLDFCGCEHCKSVLSPAAYFVDLLEMLDLQDQDHEGDDPQVVLFERRPDLQHILLTCENTNVALPYIDLVNEVLEHFVVNGSLTGFAGHNTDPSASSADLLVDPQFIETSAYAPLATAVFPVPLPFHLSLEALRLQYVAWDTTLADALAVFGTPADARREVLGLNPSELLILTDNTFKALPEHFGEPANATIAALLAEISNAKVFCRRLGLTYLELDEILTSRFINPGTVLLPLLSALKVGLGSIQSWFEGDLTDEGFLDLLPLDLDTAPYGGDVVAWLIANRVEIMGLVVLVPTEDADPDVDDCDFGQLELRLALPDPTANALTESELTKLYRFIRLWRRLGWDIPTTDDLLDLFLPPLTVQPTPADLDAAFTTALSCIANALRLLRILNVSAKKRSEFLALFDATRPAADRRADLIRFLRLGEVDFDSLVALTGLDPFAADMHTDEPSLLRFVDAWKATKGAPLKIADLDWLVRGVDPGGDAAPSPTQLRADLRTVRDALTAVEQILGTASTTDLAATQATMALVYDAGLVGRFFGLLGGSTTYAVPLATAEESVPAKLTAVAANLGIDPLGKQLTHVGLMSLATRDALIAAFDTLVLADVEEIDTQGELDAFVAAGKAAVTALQAAGVADRNDLVVDQPELGAVLDAALAADDPAVRAQIVRDGVLPELRRRLKETALRSTLAAILHADEVVVGALTSGPAVLPANSDSTVGVLADLLGIESPLDLDHDQVVDLWLDPQITADHIVYVRAPTGTVVELLVDGTPAIASAPIGPSGEAASTVALPFAVGTPLALRLTLSSVPAGGQATLLWRSKSVAKTVVPADRITPASAATEAGASLVRLRKSGAIVQALGLTARELAFFASACPDTVGVLAELPIDDSIAAGEVPPLAAKIAALVWFARFRSETESDADTWVDVLEKSELGTTAGQARVATVGSWRADDVTEAIAFLAPPAADLQTIGTLGELRAILDMAVLTNQSVADLRAWTLADPTAPDVQALKNSVKAAISPAAWRESMQSVNDGLRNLRRDALRRVHPHPRSTEARDRDLRPAVRALPDRRRDGRVHADLANPPRTVDRSALRHAVPDEPRGRRSHRRRSTPHHWQWMKRYRVWEANRKIFLYPENWLEPELRDGKSSQFKELESELLKSDITDELAENAFLGYLQEGRRHRAARDRRCAPAGRTPRQARGRHRPCVRPDQWQDTSVLLPTLRVRLLDRLGAHRPQHRGRVVVPGDLAQSVVRVLGDCRAETTPRRPGRSRRDHGRPEVEAKELDRCRGHPVVGRVLPRQVDVAEVDQHAETARHPQPARLPPRSVGTRRTYREACGRFGAAGDVGDLLLQERRQGVQGDLHVEELLTDRDRRRPGLRLASGRRAVQQDPLLGSPGRVDTRQHQPRRPTRRRDGTGRATDECMDRDRRRDDHDAQDQAPGVQHPPSHASGREPVGGAVLLCRRTQHLLRAAGRTRPRLQHLRRLRADPARTGSGRDPAIRRTGRHSKPTRPHMESTVGDPGEPEPEERHRRRRHGRARWCAVQRNRIDEVARWQRRHFTSTRSPTSSRCTGLPAG